MASGQQLDASRRARTGRFILALILVLLLLALHSSARAQESLSDTARLSASQSALDAGQWDRAAKLAHGPANQPADLDFVEGLALARLQRWEESRLAFEAGWHKTPNDPRFVVELAGIRYKQNDFQAAKRELHTALRLNSRDLYVQEFLGTLYFLDGNLEAALQHWNQIDKPRLRNVTVQPPPRLQTMLLDRAIAFNAPQVLTRDAFLDS